ncbi:MAG: AraC family transcriptional regulator [Acidimicrobiales bacterium]
MESQRSSRATVTIPDGCRDDVVPLFDHRAETLVSVGVTQVALSALVAGFDWPGPDPHTHLVLATVEGRGRLLLGDREHDLGPGTVAVCPAHTARHQWADEPWRLVTIRLAEIEPWRRLQEMGPFVLDAEDPYRFAAPVLGILGELPPAMTVVSEASRGRDPIDEFLNRFGSRMNLASSDAGPTAPTEPFSLYALVLRIQLEALRTGPPSISDAERHLASLWEAVRREPGRNWNVESSAAHLSVSRATLHRLVTRHHRSSPGAIVERIRMDHAAHLLVHGELPVKAISAQVGYATPYSFSAAFRRARGCPPSEFREQVGRFAADQRSRLTS